VDTFPFKLEFPLQSQWGYMHNYPGDRPSYTKEIVGFVQQVWRRWG